MYIKKTILSFILFLFLTNQNLFAQAIPVSTTHGVYLYLDQMAMSYDIPWIDLVKPATRTQIAKALQELLHKKEKLSTTEYSEAEFYWKEFNDNIEKKDTLTFLKKDPQLRWRTFYYKEKNNQFYAEPIFGGSVGRMNGNNVIEKNIGLTFWGSIENRIDYMLSFNDISWEGPGVKNISNFSPFNKYVNLDASAANDQKNYNELRASIAYRFKKGSIIAGQDRYSYGQGETTQIVLSQNAPAYPYIRLQYQPYKWMHFNYMHAWLQSNVLDSSARYSYGNTTYGGYHEQYQRKYYAIHSIHFIVRPGIEFNLGESIVYTNELKPGYLIPVMYFKSYDNTSNNQNILAGDNAQVFAGFNIRRWIPKIQFYGQVFVDEIRISKMFSNNNRNQLGYQVGIKKSGWLSNDGLVMGVEYTRNRPYVYSNINPVLNYTHHGQQLGDWIGNNADRLIVYAQYKPKERMYARLSYEKIRKGGPGTVEDQYLKSPQPGFLFDPLFHQKSINFEIRYQWLHNIHIQLLGNFVTVTNPNGGEAINSSYIKTGMYLGLY